LQGTVQGVISVLDQHAGGALLITAGLVASWLGWKRWQKSRFRRLADIPHITPDELAAIPVLLATLALEGCIDILPHAGLIWQSLTLLDDAAGKQRTPILISSAPERGPELPIG